MKLSKTLEGYLQACRPVIYIYGNDFESIDTEIATAVKLACGNVRIEEYNNAQGCIRFDTKTSTSALDEGGLGYIAGSCAQRLSSYLHKFLVAADEPMSCVLVLKDINQELSDPSVCACLKGIAWRLSNHKDYAVQVIIVSTCKLIPLDLEKVTTIIEAPPPTSSEIKSILLDYCGKCGIPQPNENDSDNLTLALRGLVRSEIEQILNYVQTRTGGSLAPEKAVSLILEEKKQVIQKSDLLETVKVSYAEGGAQIGGLARLISYLNTKAEVFKNLTEARRFGVSIPKGILLVGMPGCGKSLAAKECARLFKAPLVRLDVGRLLGRFVGESEENLRRALRQAEAAMPCVLWIDEIEKAFAGVGRDESGVTTRLFGLFLTWMQEKDVKDSTVYVLATANDISAIPPEFLRRGRFDEIFSVSLPSQDERKAIFSIHLAKRKSNWSRLGINIDQLAKLTGNGYSGADLEAIVKVATEQAFLRHRQDGKSDLSMADLVNAIRTIPPIKDIMKEKIEALEGGLKKFHVLPASEK